MCLVSRRLFVPIDRRHVARAFRGACVAVQRRQLHQEVSRGALFGSARLLGRADAEKDMLSTGKSHHVLS